MIGSSWDINSSLKDFELSCCYAPESLWPRSNRLARGLRLGVGPECPCVSVPTPSGLTHTHMHTLSCGKGKGFAACGSNSSKFALKPELYGLWIEPEHIRSRATHPPRIPSTHPLRAHASTHTLAQLVDRTRVHSLSSRNCADCGSNPSIFDRAPHSLHAHPRRTPCFTHSFHAQLPRTPSMHTLRSQFGH
jgi:hypothetical protein